MCRFVSKSDVFFFVCERSVLLKKPFLVERSEYRRVSVRCKDQACDFAMSFYQKNDGFFYIVEERGHTCSNLLPTIKKTWVCKKVREQIQERGKVTATEMKNWFREQFGVDVGVSMLRRAIRRVKQEEFEGDARFGLLSSFMERLSAANEGTKTSIVSHNGVFQRAFLALGMCVLAFTPSTRVLGLDACHIKASYGGVLLVMTILDGNGNVFPGALGIAESENTDTWTWFLTLVQSAFPIDRGEGAVFLSDREKGIEAAVRTIFPNANHSFCVYHIQKNVKAKFKTALDGLLFKAAKTPSVVEFANVMAQIKTLHGAAGAYIEEIDKTKWARAFFPARRFGHVTSNVSESMNWWLEDARHLQPVGLFVCYIRRLNWLFERRHQDYALLPSTAFPEAVSAMFFKSIDDSRRLRVVRHREMVFEVERRTARNTFRAVDLEKATCTCGFYKEYGVPCHHMCAAVLSLKGLPQTFIIPELRLEALQATYAGTTFPVDLSELDDDGMKPPSRTKRRGRPRVDRIPSVGEKVPRRAVSCSICSKQGHNKRTCKVGRDELN